MDLVYEEDVALLQAGQDRCDVALALEGRPRDRAEADTELLPDDERKARLPEPWRPDQEQVIERFLACLGRVERDRELLLDPLLADELVQAPRAKRAFELVFVRSDLRREELGLFSGGLAHAAFFNASRTRSSGGASGSVPESASSASTSE